VTTQLNLNAIGLKNPWGKKKINRPVSIVVPTRAKNKFEKNHFSTLAEEQQ